MLSSKEVIQQLETASTRTALVAAMQAATAYLGFQAFSVTIRVVHIGGGAWRVLLTSMPRELLDWYDRESILDEDPVLRRAMDTVAPFYSDELDPVAVSRSPKASAYLHAASRFGVPSLLTCVQHDRVGAITIATFGGAQRDAHDCEDLRKEAAWVGAHLHEALQRTVVAPVVERRGQLGRLTRIECSMLELLARGHGAREIAKLLGVTARSVRYYACRVREKLGARSLNQAVTHAIESRQISLAGPGLPTHWNGLPKLVLVPERDGLWSDSTPTAETSIRELRSADSLDRLARAARRAAAVQGFEHFAFVLRTPGATGCSQFVLTNDPAVQGGRDNPGELVQRCLTPQAHQRCVPVFWDELPARNGADSPPVLGVSAGTLSANGTSSILSMSGNAAGRQNRSSQRQACFQLARELHGRACDLATVPKPNLSPNDVKAFQQMVGGSTIRQVAAEGDHKERTLRYHLTRAARQLGARNSRHALAIAAEQGLLPRDMGRLLSRDLVRPL